MASAGDAGGRQAVEAGQSPLVLVAGPLADEAARDPPLSPVLADVAQLLLLAFTDPGMTNLVWIDVSKLVPLQIGDRELTEDVVEDRGRVLDLGVAADEARGLEAREGEGFDELLERNAILQADRHGDGEIVHQRAEGGPFLVHIEEDFA